MSATERDPVSRLLQHPTAIVTDALDETGIVVSPRARIREALELCERIASQEALLEAQVRNDAVTPWDAL
ncbi:MAG TPA: hypothetical protein VL654_08210 [Casimicrobiaceae bacterium]|jgi:regulator of RNase E activity RraA|nr:hypothetical protein [Casimicrobiaceae bacterium]